MQPIRLFKPGEKITGMRDKLNAIVREVNRLRNIQGEGIQVSHNASGVLISMPKQRLTIDDKYELDKDQNESNLIRRLGDLKSADLGDGWRVRAHPTGVEREVGERRTLPAYRVMWLINDTPAGEGGWITDAATTGLGKTEHSPEPEIPTPINAIGQIGDIVILTADDIISTTPDGDTYTLANIRDDAHFHYDPDHDGRIYFTTAAAGSEPEGLPLMGEMICDPALANFDTALGKESGEWRPQIKIPGIEYFDQLLIHPNPDEEAYQFPTAVFIPSTMHQAWEFLTTLQNGFSGHAQLPSKIPSYGLGLRIKYSALNESQDSQDAYIEFDYKMVNDGEDMSVAATPTALLIPVPALTTEQILHYYDAPIVPYLELADQDTWLIDLFARDPNHIDDTLDERLLILSIKPIIMVVPEPPPM